MHTTPPSPHLIISQSNLTFRKIPSIRKWIARRHRSVVDGNECAVEDALHEITIVPNLITVRVNNKRAQLLTISIISCFDTISWLQRQVSQQLSTHKHLTYSECAVAIEPTPQRSFVLLTVQAPRSVPYGMIFFGSQSLITSILSGLEESEILEISIYGE